FLVLFVLALTMPVPYVILSPGPTYNTLGTDDSGNTIIVINGSATKSTTGHLNLTTVNVSTQQLTAFAALDGWLLHDEVVVPKASIYPPGKSQKQVDTQNIKDFAQSQDSATAAALCELGYPKGFGVITVDPKGPSHGILEPGDRLVTLDGTPITSTEAISKVLESQTPGSTAKVAVTRGGRPAVLSVKLTTPPPSGKGARLGITVADGCLAPFEVDLGLGNQIGGPSAGLMFALGIMDKVGKVDLTKGMFIAGTGTIDTDGGVGPIGGIALKMIAARHKGATVFLAPADNCPDVRGAIPKGLQVVKVGTLHSAVQDLQALQAGQGVPHC
ncbi:MAG: PDZ domain-containing protein, partial [Pseudonocardiales bacterium]